MNEKFNIKRIGHLLNYDWMCVRKRLLLSFIIIELIYIIMIIGQHYGLKFFHNSGITPDLVLMMASYLRIMSGVALFIIWSGLVWRKFSHKETASTYMMLPANISERFVTLHLSGLLAFVIWYIFCEINVAIPTTIMFGFTRYLELDQNLHNHIQFGDLDISAISVLLIACATSLLNYIIYLFALLKFKKSPVLKSVIAILAFQLLYLGYFAYIFSKFMDKIKDVANMVDGTNHRIFWFENNVSNIMFKYPFNMSYVLILIPTILLFASVYYRIKEKEIK